MVNGMPVEMVWMGRFSSSSESGKSERLRNPRVLMRFAELRLCLAHLAEEPAVAHLKADGHPPDIQVQARSRIARGRCCFKYHAVPSVGCPAKGSSSSTVKMRTRTPSRASVSAIARQDECGFGEVHLLGKLLHLGVAQPTGVRKHRELIAFQRHRSKHIDMNEREFASRHGRLGSWQIGLNQL